MPSCYGSSPVTARCFFLGHRRRLCCLSSPSRFAHKIDPDGFLVGMRRSRHRLLVASVGEMRLKGAIFLTGLIIWSCALALFADIGGPLTARLSAPLAGERLRVD